MSGDGNSIDQSRTVNIYYGLPPDQPSPNRSDRNEKTLINAVWTEVDDRLRQSLHNAILIRLDMAEQRSQVSRPWDSELRTADQNAKPLPPNTPIAEVFDRRDVGGKLLVLGNPGAGKTTTMLDLAAALVQRANADPDEPIPVMVNLSSWQNPKQPFADWLLNELKLKYGVSQKLGQAWLSDKKLLPLLDGLDELPPARQEPAVLGLNTWLQSDTGAPRLLVCSRREEYELYAGKLDLNGAICLSPLTDEQLKDYLASLKMRHLWETLQHDDDLLELVRTPLLLSVSILANDAIDPQKWTTLVTTEERLNYVLDAYVIQRLHGEIISKQYSKDKEPIPQDTRQWLSLVAKQLMAQSQDEFLIEKIHLDWLTSESSTRLYKITLGIFSGALIGFTYGLVINLFPLIALIPYNHFRFDFFAGFSLLSIYLYRIFQHSLILAFLLASINSLSNLIKPIKEDNSKSDFFKDKILYSLLYGCLFGISICINLIFQDAKLELPSEIASVTWIKSITFLIAFTVLFFAFVGFLLPDLKRSLETVEIVQWSSNIFGKVFLRIIQSRLNLIRKLYPSLFLMSLMALLLWMALEADSIFHYNDLKIYFDIIYGSTSLDFLIFHTLKLVAGISLSFFIILFITCGMRVFLNVAGNPRRLLSRLDLIENLTSSISKEIAFDGLLRKIDLCLIFLNWALFQITNFHLIIILSMSLRSSGSLFKLLEQAFAQYLDAFSFTSSLLGSILPYVKIAFVISSMICLVAVIIVVSFAFLAAVFNGFHSKSILRRNTPNMGIKRSLMNSIFLGLMSGFLCGLASVSIGYISSHEDQVYYFSTWFNMGFLNGLWIISRGFGGAICGQHLALRCVLYWSGNGPWNYAHFLNHCTDRLLLQRVGGRYRFIHRLVQEHFAAMPLEQGREVR